MVAGWPGLYCTPEAAAGIARAAAGIDGYAASWYAASATVGVGASEEQAVRRHGLTRGGVWPLA